MKKLLILMILCAFVAAFSACAKSGNGKTTDSPTDSTSSETGDVPDVGAEETDGGQEEEKPVKTSYLFAYFRGNDQEDLCFGVSRDGRNFRKLNGGREVFTSYLGTKCMRDPFIFEGEDGAFYIVATDMKSANGWNSQSTIVIYRTTDLINITEGVLIDYRQFRGFEKCSRAWAPQVIWCPEHDNGDGTRGAYMIYLSLYIDDRLGTVLYKNFTTDLMDASKYTVPEFLLTGEDKGKYSGRDGTMNGAIDGDIIRDTVNDRWVMFFDGRHIAVSDSVEGPYTELAEPYEKTHRAEALEGSNMYKLLPKDSGGKDTWIICADGDAFGYGFCVSETNDFEKFTALRPRKNFSFDFTPRHGYVITITDEQYDMLIKEYGDVDYSGSAEG